jgi:hypothetical protein
MPDKVTSPQGDTWTEWSKYVLKELERNNDSIDSLRKDIQELKVDMATLKTKIYIIGAILGTLGGILGTALARAIVGS